MTALSPEVVPAASALAHGLERGLLAGPGEGQEWVFLNARPIPDLPAAIRNALHCEQGFRPFYLQLANAGYRVEPVLPWEMERYDGAIILAGRHRALNEANFVQAWNAVRQGGPVIMAGAVKDGIGNLRKHVDHMVRIDSFFAKSHAQVFLAMRADHVLARPPQEANEFGYSAASGMFSALHPDPGSLALARLFDSRIAGDVADFGAGWGYLGARLLEVAPGIASFDSHEADWNSLEAARRNLAGFTGVARGFFWIDLTCEPVGRRYDWIVMNPPFHSGRREADAAIGIAFIEAAARALRREGRLLLVANRHLPYEKTLQRVFHELIGRGEEGGYKLYEAGKPISRARRS